MEFMKVINLLRPGVDQPESHVISAGNFYFFLSNAQTVRADYNYAPSDDLTGMRWLVMEVFCNSKCNKITMYSAENSALPEKITLESDSGNCCYTIENIRL